MKVIDIFQKLANEEKIKKFRIYDEIYYVDDDKNICEENGKKVLWYIDEYWLNEEVEIIEEDKKIEKIDVNHLQQIKKWKRAKILGNKINEIIDKINSMEV